MSNNNHITMFWVSNFGISFHNIVCPSRCKGNSVFSSVFSNSDQRVASVNYAKLVVVLIVLAMQLLYPCLLKRKSKLVCNGTVFRHRDVTGYVLLTQVISNQIYCVLVCLSAATIFDFRTKFISDSVVSLS